MKITKVDILDAYKANNFDYKSTYNDLIKCKFPKIKLNNYFAQMELTNKDALNPDKFIQNNIYTKKDLVDYINSRKTKFITIIDDEYPQILRNYEEPSIVLFYEGKKENLKKLKNSISLLGNVEDFEWKDIVVLANRYDAIVLRVDNTTDIEKIKKTIKSLRDTSIILVDVLGTLSEEYSFVNDTPNALYLSERQIMTDSPENYHILVPTGAERIIQRLSNALLVNGETTLKELQDVSSGKYLLDAWELNSKVINVYQK